MSSRQLRKLQKQRELEQLQSSSPALESDESEEAAPIQRPKAKANLFSGFAALGDPDDDSAPENNDNDNCQDEDDDRDEANPAAATTETSSPPLAGPTSSSKKGKKKKKKAKKPDAPPTAVKQDTSRAQDVDEIDKALAELNLAKASATGATTASTAPNDARSVAYERICDLLRINAHHLRVINEMRNLFGREAIAAAENEENEERARTTAQRPRNIPQQVDLETFLKGQSGKTLPEVTLRRNIFLPGKETWPRASPGGLSMKALDTGNNKWGTVEFVFTHDTTYQALEASFFRVIQQFEPMALVHFLHRSPYHVSSLIQVSKIAKQDQNSALAADLCERALFTLGRVSVSSFRQKMAEGKARLDFRRPENRQFWLAGYHYLKSLVMKGTYRTALEWSKLLFSMDLEDPYGIIHFIHPMAIRAHESKWFIDFCDSEVLDKLDIQDYIRQTLVLARLQQNDPAGAKTLLLDGIAQLPWLYSSLYKALDLDVPKIVWGVQPRNQHEELFTELYIHQTKSLWDNAQAMNLLKEVARDGKKPAKQPYAFPPVAQRNVARFVYLDNTPSLMSVVPDGLLNQQPNWEFDPLPPPMDENIFSYDSQKQPWNPDPLNVRGPGHGFPIGAQAADIDALRRLFRRFQEGGAEPNPEQLRHMEEAFAEANIALGLPRAGEAHEDEQDEPARGPPPGVFQMLMDLFGHDTSQSDAGEELHYDSDSGMRMPGAWADSDDDEDDEDDVIRFGGTYLHPEEEESDDDDELPPLI
ncbi:transcriptional repressor TCF25-domain-containing protein [Xylariaceae sp. FL1272]|nr:transcriptional repressor TCF25-domain-containing protein [Xylariaceae sp. FL1272]